MYGRKQSPNYTFQRRKQEQSEEIETPINIPDLIQLPPPVTMGARYAKYNFYTLLIILMVMVIGMSYVFYKGVPVKVK